MRNKFVVTGMIAVVFILVCELYLYTAYPAFKNDDSPETITASYTLGIGHPPSYPLFTMAGKVFTFLPLGSPAFRMNLFSIILGLMVLLASFFVLNENSRLLSGKTMAAANAAATLVLALSYIFWNQAIEAKGGIYMLNLLFLAAIIYCHLRLLRMGGIKYLYMISYALGLSFANHWPSMAVLVPVFAFIYYKQRKNLGVKSTLVNVLLFMAGLSAYIYLPIRANTGGVFAFMARPDNWRDFLWTVLRRAYMSDNLAGSAPGFAQGIEYLKLLASNYSILWVLAAAGFAALWRQERGLAYFYSAVFLLITVPLVAFYRAPANVTSLIDVFSMPAQYVIFLLIVTGFYHISGTLARRNLGELAAILFISAALFSGAVNFRRNNAGDNYLAYDFGYNLEKTMDRGGFYIAGTDSCYMPLLYLQNVLHTAPEIVNFKTGSIQFDWGIRDIGKKYGISGLAENDPAGNITRIVDAAMDSGTVYFSTYVKIPEKRRGDYIAAVKGILFKISKKGALVPAEPFALYSYRGIYGDYPEYDRALVYVYGERMAMCADELFLSGDFSGSAGMYNRALLFSEKMEDDRFVSRADIYYNLSIDYAYLHDGKDQLKSLINTIESRKDFWQAYEDAGLIYYGEKNARAALEMFQKAIYYGSPDRVQLGRYMANINGLK